MIKREMMESRLMRLNMLKQFATEKSRDCSHPIKVFDNEAIKQFMAKP
jgi:hypothetical protein